jgi:LmbE family N-acetylglucosaminyl deacetylase
MNELPNQITQDTSRVMDITGRENTLILLAVPGEEVTACGGLIAEACARGRPPFVVILGDGTTDGPATLVPRRQLASRTACQRLGLPDDRLLFVGLRQGAFPATGTPLFKALLAAMAEVSWRRDCNVILAPFAVPEAGDAADAVAAWQLARALAAEIELPLLAGIRMAALPRPSPKNLWRLDARQWNQRRAEAGLAHDVHIQSPGYEGYARVG